MRLQTHLLLFLHGELSRSEYLNITVQGWDIPIGKY